MKQTSSSYNYPAAYQTAPQERTKTAHVPDGLPLSKQGDDDRTEGRRLFFNAQSAVTVIHREETMTE